MKNYLKNLILWKKITEYFVAYPNFPFSKLFKWKENARKEWNRIFDLYLKSSEIKPYDLHYYSVAPKRKKSLLFELFREKVRNDSLKISMEVCKPEEKEKQWADIWKNSILKKIERTLSISEREKHKKLSLEAKEEMFFYSMIKSFSNEEKELLNKDWQEKSEESLLGRTKDFDFISKNFVFLHDETKKRMIEEMSVFIEDEVTMGKMDLFKKFKNIPELEKALLPSFAKLGKYMEDKTIGFMFYEVFFGKEKLELLKKGVFPEENSLEYVFATGWKNSVIKKLKETENSFRKIITLRETPLLFNECFEYFLEDLHGSYDKSELEVILDVFLENNCKNFVFYKILYEYIYVIKNKFLKDKDKENIFEKYGEFPEIRNIILSFSN